MYNYVLLFLAMILLDYYYPLEQTRVLWMLNAIQVNNCNDAILWLSCLHFRSSLYILQIVYYIIYLVDYLLEESVFIIPEWCSNSSSFYHPVCTL